MRLDFVTAAPFGGHLIAANSVRLLIIFFGFAGALVCLGLTYRALRHGNRSRAAGCAAVGCLVANPAVSGLARFGAPLNPYGITLYSMGLVLGLVWLATNYTVVPNWLKRHRDNEEGTPP